MFFPYYFSHYLNLYVIILVGSQGCVIVYSSNFLIPL